MSQPVLNTHRTHQAQRYSFRPCRWAGPNFLPFSVEVRCCTRSLKPSVRCSSRWPCGPQAQVPHQAVSFLLPYNLARGVRRHRTAPNITQEQLISHDTRRISPDRLRRCGSSKDSAARMECQAAANGAKLAVTYVLLARQVSLVCANGRDQPRDGNLITDFAVNARFLSLNSLLDKDER